MTYRVKATFLVGTTTLPEHEGLTVKEAVSLANKLRKSALNAGYEVGDELTTAPGTIEAKLGGSVSYIQVLKD